MRSPFPPSVVLLAVAVGCAPPAPSTGPGATPAPGARVTDAAIARGRPSIVLLLADDLGYGDLGVQGAAEVPTPHLDALARAGIQCTDAYVSAPLCFPSRAALMTGRYAQRFGVEHNASVAGFELPLEERTLAERFAEAGYATGMIGKWNLGTADGRDPQSRGFDEFFGFDAFAHPYRDLDRVPTRPRHPLLRGREPVREEEYLTDAFAREAGDFIRRHAHEPFFLFVSFNAPHTPIQPRPVDRARFAARPDTVRAAYAAMVVSLDDAVGAIDAALRESGLERTALVLFLSDNGASPRSGGRNDPFRGAKGTLWEGGIRVPWVVRSPEVPRGVLGQTPVLQIDVAPTALAAAGIPFGDELDGANRLPAWSGGEEPSGALFWRYSGGDEMPATNAWAVRRGPWKLGVPEAPTRGGDPVGVGGRLVNLRDDPFETVDRAAERPDVVRDLRRLWQGWNRQLPPPHGVDTTGRGS